MTITESFLVRIKKYIPRAATSDWETFTIMARKQHVGSVYRLAQSLTNCLHGKKPLKGTYTKLTRLSIGFVLAHWVSASLVAMFKNKLLKLLERDAALPKIQRDFTDFVGTPADYVAILQRSFSIQSIFSALLTVTNWHKHEDLAADITGIAQALDTLRILNHAQFVYKKVSSNKRLQPTDLEGLQLLHSLAEKHQLIATLRALPPLPANLSKKIVTIDPEIVTAIVRFPVRDELESLNRSNQGGLENYLSDFVDFFQDYPIGEVRRQGLRNFPKRCRAYVELGIRG